METRTINQLTNTATELENQDLIPIWQDGKTKKMCRLRLVPERNPDSYPH